MLVRYRSVQIVKAVLPEYQNEPLPTKVAIEGVLTADEIARKFNRMERGILPIGCNHLTSSTIRA